MAKASGVQRESEGVMALTIPVKNNAGGGKGPCFGHAVRRGKRRDEALLFDLSGIEGGAS